VFSLPEDILIGIAANWNEISCTIKFDTACCSSVIRLQLLELFIHDGLSMTCPILKTDISSNLFLKWIYQRNIKLSSLYYLVPKNFATNQLSFSYPINSSKIKELEIDGDFIDMKLEDMINKCDNLTHLILHSANVSDELFSKVKRLSQLEFIDLSIYKIELSPKLLHILAYTCKSLHTIYLEFKSDNGIIIDDEFKTNFLRKLRIDLISLLYYNKIKHIGIDLLCIEESYQMEKVENGYFIESWGLAKIISIMCPFIETCELKYCGALNTSHVANFFRTNKLLRRFKLLNSSFYDDISREIVFDQTSEIRTIHCCDFYDINFDYQDDFAETRIECLFAFSNFFTHIDLVNIHELSDNLLHLIISRNTQTLVHLNIDKCGTNWSIPAVVTSIKTCKMLRSLELKDCDHIPNIDFKKMYTARIKLSRLVINGAQYLETETAVSFVQFNVVHFDSLYCYNCPLVDNDVLFRDETINNEIYAQKIPF
jgi:hypothetical protein